MSPIRKWLRRALRAVLVLVPLALAVIAVVLSYEKACDAPPASASGPESMQAVVRRCYGGPEVLELARVARPAPEPGHVLVKVRAAGINPYEWHFMRGTPYVMRIDSGIGAPKDARLGVDFAGVVEAVGAGVSGFAPGDAVFGGKGGALAEYVTVRADRSVVNKPDNVSFEQAASVNIAGLTALQALRDRGQLEPGQRVLINGASGGVGTFAVQIAKAYGAHVTGVCSTRNLELVRGLGADEVIDYTRQDYTQGGEPYDLIVDMVGSRGRSRTAAC